MSIAKKVRKAKMARKQKERQKKVENMIGIKLQEALEDPVRRVAITELMFVVHKVNDEPLYDTK